MTFQGESLSEESPLEIFLEPGEGSENLVIEFKEAIFEIIQEEPATLEVVLIDLPDKLEIIPASSEHIFSVEMEQSEEEDETNSIGEIFAN